jgi:uncharacterized protein (DUF488 family)
MVERLTASSNVFAVQDEIAENVAGALRVVLSDRERRVIGALHRSFEAYDLFLRGREQLHRLERSGFTAAWECSNAP